MTGQAVATPKPKPNRWGSKKRYSILLPHELAERFERVAKLRNGAKSALVEEALDRRLCPEKYPLIDDALLRRLDEQADSLATLKREAAVNTEMISLFVRYFLTITPPLADSEQQPARTLGRKRFEVFIAQIGRRLASDRRLVSDVLEWISAHDTDLLITVSNDSALRARSTSTARPAGATPRSNGHAPAATATETQHG